jgi:hypothetical protein
MLDYILQSKLSVKSFHYLISNGLVFISYSNPIHDQFSYI